MRQPEYEVTTLSITQGDPVISKSLKPDRAVHETEKAGKCYKGRGF